MNVRGVKLYSSKDRTLSNWTRIPAMSGSGYFRGLVPGCGPLNETPNSLVCGGGCRMLPLRLGTV